MEPEGIERPASNLRGVIVALGYFVLAAISLRLTRYAGGAAFVWPAGPLLFAALTVMRRRKRLAAALWCLPAATLASALFGMGWQVALPLAVANVGEAYLAAWCVRRAYPRFGQFRSAKEILWFVAIAGVAVPGIISFVGALFIHLSGHTPYWPTLRDWFLAHSVGLISFGPLMILMLSGQLGRWHRSISRRKTVEAVAIMLVVACVAVVTFGQSRVPLLAVPFLPMMFATLRLGRFGAVSSVVIVIIVASACSLAGIGPMTLIHGGMGLRLQALQIYFATVVLVILPTAAELKARGRTFERLRKLESLNRLMLDHTSDIILRLSLDGIIQYVSPALRRYGAEPANLIGQKFECLLKVSDRGRVMAINRAAAASCEEIFSLEWQSVGKTQAPRSFEANARAIVDDAGLATGVVYVVRDVTERAERSRELEVRARAAAALEEANRLLLMAEDMSAVGHWRVDVASGMTYWSDAVCAIHGRPHGYSPTVDTAILAYHPDDRSAVETAVRRALSEGSGYSMRARIIRTDGAIRHVALTGRVEMGPTGSITELFGVFQDVTDAQEAQEALVAANDRLVSSHRMLTMAEAVGNLGHWRLDGATRALFWSQETYRIYGVAESSTPTVQAALALYNQADAERMTATLLAALERSEGYTSRARIIRPDGTARHILTRGEIERGADGEPLGLFGIVQDVTEQVLAEESRAQQAEQYLLITEQASDLIVLTDEEGAFKFVSPSSRSILGYAPEEMVGLTPYDFAHDEDQVLLRKRHAELSKRSVGEVVSFRFRMRHKGGDHVWMDVATRVASLGNPTRVISACRDITAQVLIEEALRTAQVRAEAAVVSKSSFLANMSHEIRTPMNGVVGFAELLLAGELDAEQRRQAELIAESGKAMMRLLNDILDLSKVEAGRMTIANEPFDLAHALRACLALVAPALDQKNIALHTDIAPDLPPVVLGDALRVRQVILNLLGNAAKFTLAGRITLSVRINDDVVLIGIRDTGIGIAPDRQSAIFEQFAQADDGIARRFGGTGLGLAISSRLATLMGGVLSLESELGSGSLFTLSLPLHAATALSGADFGPSIPSAPAAAPRRVLVAEDHDVNQLLISAMLRKLGCESDLATDGEQAVRMVGAAIAEGRPYSLVLMDMQMPGTDGVEATRRIRASGINERSLPIVAITANAFRDDVDACLDAGMQAHIAKPFSLNNLRSALIRWTPSVGVNEASDGLSTFDDAIQSRYRARKDAALRALDRLTRAGSLSERTLVEITSMLHQLAGTAGMFGDAELGKAAGRLEEICRNQAAGEIGPDILQTIEALRRAS